MLREQRRGALLGLGAAALFGASVPIAKLLVPQAGPLMLSALLYLGAGLALAGWKSLVVRQGDVRQREAALRRSDLPLLAGVVLAGGALGPFLLISGLARSSGVAASLLLNLEAPFTVLFAVAL